MSAEARVQFSIRIDPSAKRALSDAAEKAASDASTVAREVLELVVQRIEAGGGDVESALGEMRDLWRGRLRTALEQRLNLANQRLNSLQPRDEYEATCREISEIATKLAEA